MEVTYWHWGNGALCCTYLFKQIDDIKCALVNMKSEKGKNKRIKWVKLFVIGYKIYHIVHLIVPFAFSVQDTCTATNAFDKWF